jgi:phospholipid/cholesterol/gamma-HCH transport system substrate-binding protein
MGRFTTSAKVGVFAVATGAAALGIYRFVDKRSSTGKGYVVYTLFNDALGIAKHSQVRVSGIPVGTIESVRLDHGKARIDIRINPDIQLHVDASATKVSSSLLGEYFISIAPGTDGRDTLKDGDQIPVAVEAVTTDTLMREVAGISDDVKRVTRSLADSVGTEEGKENLKETLKHLAEVTQALNETVRENRESLRHIFLQVEKITSRGEPEVHEILQNIRESTTDIRQMLAKPEPAPATATTEPQQVAAADTPQGAAKDAKQPQALAKSDQEPDQRVGDVRRILDKVDRASSSLESTLSHLDSVAGRIDRGEGTVGRLTKDERLINEVEGVTQTVGDYVGGINRLQTIVSLRADYQFLSSSVKSYVQLRLQPREDKYYAIEVVNDPRGSTSQQQVAVETTNPNDPPVYFERRTVTTNSARFSLQFAQRFGPFWGRFGFKESTGGLGLDTLLLDDRFEFVQDLYGFGEVVLPRWRLSLGYEFLRRMWLLGGTEDVLSRDRRDYFLGVQLRFNDEDLKTILPFSGSAVSGAAK